VDDARPQGKRSHLNIVILGSCKLGPYHVLAVPNPIPDAHNTDKGYEIASRTFYPAIQKADVVIVFSANGKLGVHTRKDMLFAVEQNKRIIIITNNKTVEL
jgi:hypothetical protein